MRRCCALLIAAAAAAAASSDWLLAAARAPATASPFALGALTGVTLSNGLLSATLVTSPFFGLWDLASHLDQPAGESLLRALGAEAVLTCAGACAARPPSPPPFRLIANDSAATGPDCAFVGQGNSTSLGACEASCWQQPTCTTINWGSSGAPDCVLRACASPLAPALSPYPGFQVLSALAPSARAPLGSVVAGPSLGRSVTAGPYLNRTGLADAGALAADPASPFEFLALTQAPMDAPFDWLPGARGSDASLPWPPPGLRLVASFAGLQGSAWAGVLVNVSYALYDGMPLLGKWVDVACPAASCSVVLDGVQVASLALNPGFSPVATSAYPGNAEDVPSGTPVFPGTGRLTALTSLQYGVHAQHSNDVVTAGGDAGSTQPRLTVGDDAGLALALGGPSGAPFASVRLYLLLHDEAGEQGVAVPLYPSSETYWGCTLGPCAVPGSGTPLEGTFTERRGLALRRFLLAVAPQVAEAPLQYHLAVSDSASVRAACDQMAAVGWEMLVLSYGSGFDVESTDPAYLARVAADVAYCRGKGIEVGGYDVSRGEKGGGGQGARLALLAEAAHHAPCARAGNTHTLPHARARAAHWVDARPGARLGGPGRLWPGHWQRLLCQRLGGLLDAGRALLCRRHQHLSGRERRALRGLRLPQRLARSPQRPRQQRAAAVARHGARLHCPAQCRAAHQRARLLVHCRDQQDGHWLQ